MCCRNNFIHLAWYGGNNFVHFASADALTRGKRATPDISKQDNFVHFVPKAGQKYALCL
jgi:hypothetical protein